MNTKDCYFCVQEQTSGEFISLSGERVAIGVIKIQQASEATQATSEKQ